MDRLDTDTELRAFVNQQIYEFESLVMDNAVISVKMKNPQKTIKRLNKLEEFPIYEDKAHEFCISIEIKAGKSKVTSYGFSDDIYDAVIFAKNEMVKTLHANINESISNADQMHQIEQIRQGFGIKH